MANDYRAYVECDYNSIYHYGIKGTKWGVRRFQNEDGSLTPAGEQRYLVNDGRVKHDGGKSSNNGMTVVSERKVKINKKRKKNASDEDGGTTKKKSGGSRLAMEMYKSLKRGTLKEDLDDYYKNAGDDGEGKTEDFGSYRARKSGHPIPTKTKGSKKSKSKTKKSKSSKKSVMRSVVKTKKIKKMKTRRRS